jgi:hypothetical protein
MAELTAEERRLTQRVAAPNKLGLPNALDQLRAGRREDVRALLDAQPVVLKRFDARLQELGIVAQRSTDRGQDR